MSEELTSQAEMPEEEPVKTENSEEELIKAETPEETSAPGKWQQIKGYFHDYKRPLILAGSCLTAASSVCDLKKNGGRPTNPLVLAMLNEDGKSASEMTQNLCALRGNMADGFIALWDAGKMNGIHTAVDVFLILFGVAGITYWAYDLCKNIIAEQNFKQNIRNACINPSAKKQPMGIKEESE